MKRYTFVTKKTYHLPFDPILSIQHHANYRVTGTSFALSPNKNWLQKQVEKFIDIITQEGQP